MGRVAKGERCSVTGCEESAVRSISAGKVEDADLKVEKQRRVYLCRKHYKEYKKRVKNERRIERWRWKNR